MQPTIVALATAPLPAGLAVVRLSGPLAHQIAQQISGLGTLRHAHLRFCALHAGAELIDRGYVVIFQAPRSFTGEDIAEFQIHGSLAVVDRLLAACTQLGAQPARPGEFSQRAFENGKLDLLQAEALADLISARAETARQTALQALDGVLSDALAALREPLIHAIADLEARIDFTHEPLLAEVDRPRLKKRLEQLRQQLQELVGTAQAGRMRLHGARVVLYGAPNAGKSTLFNALVGADRALVDARPGTTRDTVEVQTAPGGVLLTWVDTAGQRDAEDPVEQAGRQRAVEAAAHADVVLWLEDRAQPFSQLPPPQTAGQVLHVHSKLDLPAHPDWQKHPQWQSALGVTAVDLPSVRQLRQAIVAAVQLVTAVGQVTLTRERHVAALTQAVTALDRALLALANHLPLELLAADLRDAALALDELTGAIVPDDVLAAVFGQFCIGK